MNFLRWLRESLPDPADDRRPLPEHCSVTESVLELEGIISREVFCAGDRCWELSDVSGLLTALGGLGFAVSLQSFGGDRWQAVAAFGTLTPKTERMVVERAEHSPAIALARCAVAAVRHWPESLRRQERARVDWHDDATAAFR